MTSASGNEKYVQARFSAKRANGLAKPSNGLASRSAGLGLCSTPKSKPKPEKARLRWCKPVLQAENVTLQIVVSDPIQTLDLALDHEYEVNEPRRQVGNVRQVEKHAEMNRQMTPKWRRYCCGK
ncbi:hypothetical protein B0H13DRAFT_1875799 [Mycena leptocephala]|nr:hypothetical protein B0H13DRAFT_1875799 [Mycena leptocephala]